jgi:DNA-binding protein HU-beta
MAGKADLINSIVDAVEGMTRRQASTVLDAVFGAIVASLKAGENAKVPGFGSFSVSERAARKGRNPATGETINIKASKSIRFKPGKELKDTVNAPKRRRASK